MNELSILITVAVIIFTSPYLSKMFKMPIPPVEIILGMLAGYYGFISDYYLFELVAEIGFFYLMFLAGVEVNLRVFVRTDKALIKKGLVYVCLLYFFSFCFTLYMGYSMLMMVILPLLSIGLILTLYKEYGKDQPWLNLAMFVGIMGELVSIALLTFTGAILEFGIGAQLYMSLVYLVGFLALIIILFQGLQVLFWWFPQLKIFLMPHYDKDEKDIRLSMSVFIVMIAIMIFLRLEIAFGAFIAGAFIATFFEHKKELPHKLSSFGFGFLVPTFFIYIGSTFPLNALQMEGVVTTAATITLAMLMVRQLSSIAFWKHLGAKKSCLLALSHSMPLTLLIAVATIAFKSRTISETLYYALILTSLAEVIIAMLGIKLLHVVGKIKK